MKVFTLIVSLVTLMTASSCVITKSVRSRIDTANTIALKAGLSKQVVTAGNFHIQTWHRGKASNPAVLEVYIEGDGLAWRRKHRLSENPTPVDPVALRLAAASPAASVVYMARPCQFTDDIESVHCTPGLWSTQRYSKMVVDAMNSAINRVKSDREATSIVLVGYSGGGVVATLLAARRDDVERLITVAANLDIKAWTTHHRVSPLSGSLNPVDFVESLTAVSQVHLAGEEDDIVPVSVVRSYVAALGEKHRAEIKVLPGYSHDCCWAEQWQELHQELLR